MRCAYQLSMIVQIYSWSECINILVPSKIYCSLDFRLRPHLAIVIPEVALFIVELITSCLKLNLNGWARMLRPNSKDHLRTDATQCRAKNVTRVGQAIKSVTNGSLQHKNAQVILWSARGRVNPTVVLVQTFQGFVQGVIAAHILNHVVLVKKQNGAKVEPL